MSFFGLFKRAEKKQPNATLQLEMTRELERYLRPQLDELARLDVRVGINEITAAYILNLLAVSRKNGVNPNDACAAAKGVFPDTETNNILINNAFQVLACDAEAKIKLAALFTLAQKEISAEKYEFLVRHSKKVALAIEAMFEPGDVPDLRNMPPWSSQDLA